ncbi:MAG TPA: globin domain-containing protein [Streptosporangiaceae bacterium]|nr:globin domain-containing protein [Streptosporangiaceae bacterium]
MATDAPEAAPTAVLERPEVRPEARPQAEPDEPPAERPEVRPARDHAHRRRWLGGQWRDVPSANALGDLVLLGRVRDRLRELPDQSAIEEEKSAPDGDQTIAAIRDTFAIVAAAGDMAAAYFYGWLFAANPALRELFPPAMDEQRDRLFRALTQIVQSLQTPEEMVNYLAQLGRDHRKYAVRPEMYAEVGAALIATLRAFAGTAFTGAAEEAWVSTYGVASDVMIKAAEEVDANAPAYWHAEVVEHERRGNGIAIVTIAPEERFHYSAGQHVTVQTRRWPRVWRPYSIACRPREDGLIRFHVKAVSGGWVSSALVDHTHVGDPLILGPAVGNMTLAPAERRDLLCVAGGTGLAPLKAIAEQVVFEESAVRHHRNVWLFLGAKSEQEFYDLRDLWRLTDVYPWLQVHPVASDDPAYHGMQGNVGRVAARYMPHADCEAYVAGPAAMVRETLRVLGKAGIPSERIHFDDGLLAERGRVGSGTVPGV